MSSNPVDSNLAPSALTGPEAVKSFLAADLKIVGEITSTGSVEVLGEIEGNLTARGVTVGDAGRVTGSVTAKSVDVKGSVDGRVATGDLTLRGSAQVKADVTYATLVIESGAQMKGSMKLSKA